MQVIETTAHVGSDGMLRIAVAMNERRDQDVRVAVVVDSSPRQSDFVPDDKSSPVADPWAAYSAKLEAAGVAVPPVDSWSTRTTEVLRFDGIPVAQSLVEDRR